MSFGKRKQTELYDLINDPDCVVNLAGNPKFYKVEKNLRVQLQIELKKQKDPRMFDRGFFLTNIHSLATGIIFTNDT
jgi:hypothetical protein